MLKTLQDRSAGVLCHISSLPGSWGHGDLGPQAADLVGFLARAGQSWWQMLPCHPTGPGNSPYQALSVFAGNPFFISLEGLAERGLLDAGDLEAPGDAHLERADFTAAADLRLPRLRRAWENFEKTGPRDEKLLFDAFCRRESYWLDEWSYFSAAKRRHGGDPWTQWGALREDLQRELHFEKFLQYAYDLQWKALRSRANAAGIGLIGDMPIFVSHDSADVWAHPELFQLDGAGNPLKVAGCPPDYFSADGQHWGNPLYRWDVHEASGYAWWIARFRRAFEMFDAVRVDHFIGFHRGWEIPAGAATAREGAYAAGPGGKLLEALHAAFGPLPVIAEDLGVVTPEVTELRRRYQLPGMRVLQFSFGGGPDQLPDRFEGDTVAYTGTHDNDTTLGWLKTAPAAEINLLGRWLLEKGSSEPGEVWPVIEAAFQAPSRQAIIPLQDLLELGSEARMNTPGTIRNNWLWRLLPGRLTPALAQRLLRLTTVNGRI